MGDSLPVEIGRLHVVETVNILHIIRGAVVYLKFKLKFNEVKHSFLIHASEVSICSCICPDL